MYLDFSALSPNESYHTIIQTVIPRPIAWILTENEDGSLNLAPFSFFAPVASSPPLLMVSIGNKGPDEKKDTARNILTSKKCVLHIADQSLVGALNQSAETLAYGESEVTSQSLAMTDFEGVDLPRIADAPVAYACEFHDMKEIGDGPMSLMFLELKKAYISDEITLPDDTRLSIGSEKLDPLARLGGNDYAGLLPAFTLERP
ncbi:flavin reductase family protein [Leucothrix sargassi]|nr:flavin reductase family protein [Leucothrix sargassi]